MSESCESCKKEFERLHEIMDERDMRYEQRFRDQENARTLALTGIKELMAADKIAFQEYKEKANEMRSQLDRQAETFATKESLTDLRDFMSGGTAKHSLVMEWLPIIIAVAAVIVAVMALRH